MLERNDFQSGLWLRLKDHLRAEIDTLRRKNDGDHDPVATAAIRGEIKALKKLLALDEGPGEPPITP